MKAIKFLGATMNYCIQRKTPFKILNPQNNVLLLT